MDHDAVRTQLICMHADFSKECEPAAALTRLFITQQSQELRGNFLDKTKMMLLIH